MLNRSLLICVFIATFVCFVTAAQGGDEVSSDQFLINKTMLFSNGDQNVRIVAAKQLLLSEEKQARDFVISVLSSNEEYEAKISVLHAIIESPKWSNSIPNIEQLAPVMSKTIAVNNLQVSNLGCKAISVFSYDLVCPTIAEVAFNSNNPIYSRLQAINALKMSLPNRNVIPQLVKLLDDPVAQISQAAGEALQEWVPLGKDKKIWGQVIAELNQKTPDQIVKERLLRQETKLRQSLIELEALKSDYLLMLEELYNFHSAGDGRKKFLLAKLQSKHAPVRFWALEKVSQWRNSTKLPQEFSPILIAMIADVNVQVRLAVANLLVYMSDINPDKSLLVQLKKETNDTVAIAQLKALSEACYFAFITNGSDSVDSRLKIEAISLAQEFLRSANKQKVLAGAESLTRMIEKNGIGEDVVRKSLSVLQSRFDQEASQGSEIAVNLLEAMARLCEKKYHYNSLSAKVFHDSFMKFLATDNEVLKNTAMNGLINVDNADALKVFKSRKMYDDAMASVVAKVVAIAALAGQSGDLHWLVTKLNNNNLAVWDSMLKILSRCDSAAIWDWVGVLEHHADITMTDDYGKVVDDYFKTQHVDVSSKTTLYAGLLGIKVDVQRPLWKNALNSWKIIIAPPAPEPASQP